MSVRTECWDIAHEWANRQDGSGIGAGGNMLYGGGCVYSYGDHFIIAKHVKNEAGERAVLFTERTYSQTTAKHIAIVRNASSHLNIIHVADPALTHEEVFADWKQRIITIAEKLAQAKRPQKYATLIADLYSEAQRYADFFGQAIPEQLAQAGNIRNSEQFADYLAKDREERAIEQAKQKKRSQKLQQAKLKAWRAFETNSFISADGWDYLRCNVNTCEVETTQQITFSLYEGKALFSFISDTIAKGGCTDCKETFLGQYPIIEVSKDQIRIGCHKVAIKEINRFADQQGWL
jgi:hypothetical protein